MALATLNDRAVVAVGGETARDFLQALVTNDMALCTPDHPIYAALLTPQGKILFEFIVHERDGAFLLDCAAALAADLQKRLTMYRLRAKIDIGRRDDLAVAIGADGGPPDPRLPALGSRVVAQKDSAADGTAAYHDRRLALGVPDSADLPPDTVFPLDAGLEELNGVSFKKGCYVGQEVTARMKHRATARRRMLIADVDGPLLMTLPPPGTPVLANAKELGTLATGAGSRALALIRLDRWDEAKAADAAITASGLGVTLAKPDWLSL